MLVNYKSYVCSKLGKVDSLRIECFNRTKLKRGHVRVRIYAIGLNYVDYLMIKGSNATGLNELSKNIIRGAVNVI